VHWCWYIWPYLQIEITVSTMSSSCFMETASMQNCVHWLLKCSCVLLVWCCTQKQNKDEVYSYLCCWVLTGCWHTMPNYLLIILFIYLDLIFLWIDAEELPLCVNDVLRKGRPASRVVDECLLQPKRTKAKDTEWIDTCACLVLVSSVLTIIGNSVGTFWTASVSVFSSRFKIW